MNDSEIRLDESRHPWSFGHKLRRGSWLAIWAVLGRPGPRRLSPFRVMLLRLFGAKIGENVLVCGGVKVLMPWNLEIDHHAAISEAVDIYNFGKVTIGHNTCVSRGVWICTGSHDYNDPTFTLIWKDISIGHSAWIAGECFLAPGVRIGDGAVVAARSVVSRNLEGWNVYAGNPCKLIKPRPRPRARHAAEDAPQARPEAG